MRSGSDDSGTPSSKESIAAKARRKAERKAGREQGRGGSSRQRSVDRSRGGQPGHPGHGLTRDPDPQQREQVDPPTVCRGCGDDLAGAGDAGTGWSQIWDVKVIRWRTEYLLPRRRCGCATITTACPPAGRVVNGISFGPVLGAAAVALTAFGNVPVQRAGTLIEILYGQPVSAGFVDRANARLAERLGAAGFGAAMQAALLAEPVLTADESPVQVVTPAADPQTGQPVPGSPHVMVIRTPDERLVWLIGLVSRGYDTVIAGLRSFAGHLIVDGYGAYQRLLTGAGAVLAGIQQCCAHVMRRCRAVAKLGPGTLQVVLDRQGHRRPDRGPRRGRSGQGPPPERRGPGPAGRATQTLRPSGGHRDHPQPSPRLGRRRQPSRVRPGHLVEDLRRAGLALHRPLRGGLDLQRRRTRRQTRQAPSSRLRVLADRPDPGPMVPDPVLSHLGPQPRPHHAGRHHPRPGRSPLATQTGRGIAAPLTVANPRMDTHRSIQILKRLPWQALLPKRLRMPTGASWATAGVSSRKT